MAAKRAHKRRGSKRRGKVRALQVRAYWLRERAVTAGMAGILNSRGGRARSGFDVGLPPPLGGETDYLELLRG
jgi:hypothetical protein